MSWAVDTLAWTGVLIALVLVLRRPVCRWFGPRIAYALWILPFARLFLPPVELPSSWAPQEAAAEIAYYTVTSTAVPATEPGVAAPGLPWLELLLALWLAGALAFIALRIRSYRQMRALVLDDALPVGEVGDIRLVETGAIGSPLAFGLFDKVIALPTGFLLMEDRAARDLAIAHELAHHRAHDILANFAAQPLFALHWFNPLAWLGWRALRRDQEAACDARVADACDRDARAKYAATIAGFAAAPEAALAAGQPAAMMCPILGEKSIIHRLRSLSMHETTTRRSRAGKYLLAGAALALPLTASISYAAEEIAAEPHLSSATARAAPAQAQDADGQERRVRVFVTADADADADSDESDDGEAGEGETKREVRVIRLSDGEDIRFDFDAGVSNEEIRARIETALGESDVELKRWTGGLEGARIVVREFGGDAEELRALIRTEEGCDAAAEEIVTERQDGETTVLRICKIAALKIAEEAAFEGMKAAREGLREALVEIRAQEDLTAEQRERAEREIRRTLERLERAQS
ncbi:M56 family metallopeptidase [Alteriqipengyuania sp. WL0013]|uniref:M56 family metallopeptidase n=1 Tax=Alteriqipengyuania sp. WL0013 TaxID=3110773 RepID=UPI002C6B0439|nr:M56 family metallopeptidase [Alteriqipengyuania sp. WL0013]MEB3414781.1 M56 family metallopeptidase [Alteriqipengyuania sp. WL0013]